MDFEFSEIERDFAESLRRYAHDRLRPEYSKWDRGTPYPRERLRELATLGIPGLRVPAGYGGAEATYLMGGIAAEELARGDYNITLFVQLSMIAADLISGFATAPCKERWLRGLARGDEIVAFGLTEPGAGSDAAALATTATRDGDSYVVNGEKASITFAGMADACIVFARMVACGRREPIRSRGHAGRRVAGTGSMSSLAMSVPARCCPSAPTVRTCSCRPRTIWASTLPGRVWAGRIPRRPDSSSCGAYGSCGACGSDVDSRLRRAAFPKARLRKCRRTVTWSPTPTEQAPPTRPTSTCCQSGVRPRRDGSCMWGRAT